LSFGAEVKAVFKGAMESSVKPNFKKREMEILDDRRQTERWSFTREGGGATYGLRQSMIEKWLDCREQFRLEVVHGFKNPMGSAAIDFGEWWHWLLGRHYGSRHQSAATPMKDLEQAVRIYSAKFQQENPHLPEKRRDAMELGFLKTKALWPVYLEKYAAEDAEKEWVGIEQEWEFDYSLPPLCLGGKLQTSQRYEVVEVLEGCKVPLSGIMDGVFRKDGRLWLFETKTKSRIDEMEIEDTLQFDIQVNLYLYAIYRIFNEWPAGVQYNVIRNPSTEPGKRNAETHDEFVERLSKDVAKDEDHYFKRWELEVTQEHIESFLNKTLDPILRDIQLWAYGITPHYVHTKALAGKYGKCAMYDPITKGDFTGVEQLPATRKER
jgi:hypothetical protein